MTDSISTTTDDQASAARGGALRQSVALIRSLRWLWVFLLAPLPMLSLHLNNMWQRPQHQYFPIVLIAVVLLLWTRLKPMPVRKPTRRLRLAMHLLPAASCLLLLIGTVIVFSPWLSAVAFVLACGAVMLILAQRYSIENLFGIWLLLWLIVPLPGVYEHQLSHFLQRLTTVLSGNVLATIGVPNLVEGTTLSAPGRQLFVEEACSGIVSMLSIVACCLILAVWANRAWLHALLLVAGGFVLAAVTNVLRIVTLAVADVWWNIDLVTGWKHALLGNGLFLLAVALALSTDRLLHFLLAPIVRLFDDQPELPSWWTRSWNHVTRLGMPRRRHAGLADFRTDQPIGLPSGSIAWVVLFLLAGTGSLYAISNRDSVGSAFEIPPHAAALAEQSLPQQFSDWRRVGFSNAHSDRLFAQNSKVWTYRSGEATAVFSFDFSFDHWHALDNCYTAVGWDRISPPILARRRQADGEHFLQCSFSDAQLRGGLLMYCLVDDAGNPFDPPQAVSVFETTRRRLQKGSETLYQIQLWVTSAAPLSSDERDSARELFVALRADLIHHLRRRSDGKSL